MKIDRCLVCHRKLKSKESQAIGIGPVCLARINKVKKDQMKRHEEKLRKNKIEKIPGQISLFKGTF